MIVTGATCNRIEKCCFAIRASSVAKKESLFPREPGERVSGHALHEGDQGFIAIGYAAEKSRPRRSWTRCIGRDASLFCNIVIWPMGAGSSRSQVNDSTRRVQ